MPKCSREPQQAVMHTASVNFYHLRVVLKHDPGERVEQCAFQFVAPGPKRNKGVSTMKAKSQPDTAQQSISPFDLEEEVRRRAYELYAERGYVASPRQGRRSLWAEHQETRLSVW